MSRSTRRRITTAGIAAAAIALGVAAEAVAYDWSDVSSWVPDLAVGWGLVALGLTARRVSPQSRCGGLVCAAGLAWFIGNFAVVDLPAIAWIGRHGAFLHRALLAHAVVGFPGGRLVSLLRRGVVTAAYVVVLWPALATSEAASMALGAAVLVVTVLNGPAAACAGVAFALAVGGVAADRRFLAPVDQTALLRFYEAALLRHRLCSRRCAGDGGSRRWRTVWSSSVRRRRCATRCAGFWEIRRSRSVSAGTGATSTNEGSRSSRRRRRTVA